MKNYKFIAFVFYLIITNLTMLLFIYFYTKLMRNVLFFDAIFIAFICSLVIGIIWVHYNKNKLFENFLVIFSAALFNIIFIYLGPITLDRSLSSFIYFYAVEKGEINADVVFDEAYFKPYIKRRFTDGEKIGFLSCSDDNICKPTQKTKIIYRVLYPLGKVSHTLENYKNFKSHINQKNKI